MISDQIIKDLRNNLIKHSEKDQCNIPVTITQEIYVDVPCYWVRTSDAYTQQVILYLHGGTNIMGSIETHKNLVTRIVDKVGIQACFVEYSLAPEHPFPKGFQEIVSVYKELLNKFLPENIVIIGDSAGGQQGLALLLKLKEDQTPLPAAYVGLSPGVDITPTTLRDNITRINGQDPVLNDPDEVIPFVELYYNNYSPRNPFISPIYGNLAGLPPMLIQVSTTEALVFQCEEFTKKVEKAGGTIILEKYEEELHTWQFHHPNSINSKKSFDNIAKFIHQQTR